MWLPKGVFFIHKKETHGHDEIHSLTKKMKNYSKAKSSQMETTILDKKLDKRKSKNSCYSDNSNRIQLFVLTMKI